MQNVKSSSNGKPPRKKQRVDQSKKGVRSQIEYIARGRMHKRFSGEISSSLVWGSSQDGDLADHTKVVIGIR